MKNPAWLAGRNGWDRYCTTLLFLALIPSSWPYGYLATIPVLLYMLFRVLSKNIPARKQELAKHDAVLFRIVLWMRPFVLLCLQFFTRLVRKFREIGTRLRDRKTHVFPKCPSCKKRLRLPRRKGMLEVNCPVCGNVFRRMT